MCSWPNTCRRIASSQQRKPAEEALAIVAKETGLDPARVSAVVRQGGIYQEISGGGQCHEGRPHRDDLHSSAAARRCAPLLPSAPMPGTWSASAKCSVLGCGAASERASSEWRVVNRGRNEYHDSLLATRYSPFPNRLIARLPHHRRRARVDLVGSARRPRPGGPGAPPGPGAWASARNSGSVSGGVEGGAQRRKPLRRNSGRCHVRSRDRLSREDQLERAPSARVSRARPSRIEGVSGSSASFWLASCSATLMAFDWIEAPCSKSSGSTMTSRSGRRLPCE